MKKVICDKRQHKNQISSRKKTSRKVILCFFSGNRDATDRKGKV